MDKKRKIPKVLYKYRAFSELTLEMLVVDKIFFADPSTFNDPLDARPSLEIDSDTEALTSIVRKLVEKRVEDEMLAAAKTLKKQGPNTQDHIVSRSRLIADQIITDIRYNSTDPD